MALSDTLTDDVVAYRSLSTLAVLGAVTAVLSCAALVTPYLSLAPLVAAVLSAAGLHSVRSSPESRTGEGLAAAGLALSLAVLVAVTVRDRYAQSLNVTAAEAVAGEFLDRIARGDTAGAFELTLDLPSRQPTPEAARDKYAADEAAAERLGEFVADDTIQRLLADARAKEFDPQAVGRTRIDRSGPGQIGGLWTYRLPATSAGPATGLMLKVERPAKTGAGLAAWRVSQVDFARPAD